MMETVIVNDNCEDEEGNQFNLFASSEMVNAGLMINEPVKVQYPDGHVEDGNRVLITKTGLSFLKSQNLGQ